MQADDSSSKFKQSYFSFIQTFISGTKKGIVPAYPAAGSFSAPFSILFQVGPVEAPSRPSLLLDLLCFAELLVVSRRATHVSFTLKLQHNRLPSCSCSRSPALCMPKRARIGRSAILLNVSQAANQVNTIKYD